MCPGFGGREHDLWPLQEKRVTLKALGWALEKLLRPWRLAGPHPILLQRHTGRTAAKAAIHAAERSEDGSQVVFRRLVNLHPL